MDTFTREEWQGIGHKLAAPFDPADVSFRVQGRANEQTGKAQVVAYVDARAVAARLDAVVGPGGWAFEWQPINVDAKGEVTLAKGTLIVGGVAKSDAGSASNFEASLGAVSHCFKRAAVLWGIGRYLYDVGSAYVSVEKGGRIADAVLRDLRGRLPKPNGASSSGSGNGTRAAANGHTPSVATSRPGAPAMEVLPEDEAPDPSETNITTMDAKRASEMAQRDLAAKLRAAGMATTTDVERFITSALGDGRSIEPLQLKGGSSDLTVGELRTLIAALSRHNQQRAEAGN